MKLSTGMNVPIHSYKHDQSLHRIWKKAVVLYQDDDQLITANNRTRVIEHDGRSWHTREPAICTFYTRYWFNVIAMFKKDGIQYYCNLSSPYLYDGEAIKYIDYDLDIKFYPDGSFRLLDEREYQVNMMTMHYPEEIKMIIRDHLSILKTMIINREGPFNQEHVKASLEQFRKMGKRR
ncbi:MAG: DUF402 domain-containing protein [Acholeplasmataceae bacterium]|nr:DUF402 domain-containing protein [Acholeplasmataceae bacterium]